MRNLKTLVTLSVAVCALVPPYASASGDRSITGLKDDELKVCSSEMCKVATVDNELFETLLVELLRSSSGKQFKTCQYSIEGETCSRSFISFVSKGINIFEGRAGFTGFRVTDTSSDNGRSVQVDIDNYPWVFGSDLNEENVKSASHQRCDSSRLQIESKRESLVLALRDYQCHGRVYNFRKNFLLTLRRIDTDSGQFLFSYYIDIKDGATGSGTGYTTLEFGSLSLNSSTLATVKKSFLVPTLLSVPPNVHSEKENREALKSKEQSVEKGNSGTEQKQAVRPPSLEKPNMITQPLKKEERKPASIPKATDLPSNAQSKPISPRDKSGDSVNASQEHGKPPQKGEGIFDEKALDPSLKKDTKEPIRVRNPLDL